MKLTVIGHRGAYPGPGEATSCYLVEEGASKLLLDCGSGALSLLQRKVGLPELSAVVLTHYHADHVADIGCLQYACLIDMDLGRRKEPLRIYGHDRDPAFGKLSYRANTVGIAYDPDAVLDIDGFLISFRLASHSDPCYAIKVSRGGKSFVYTGDTGYSPDLADFAKGVDLLVSESSLYDENRGRVAGHMCAGEAGLLASEAGAKALILSHLPPYGEQETLVVQARRSYAGPIALARPGLEATV